VVLTAIGLPCQTVKACAGRRALLGGGVLPDREALPSSCLAVRVDRGSGLARGFVNSHILNLCPSRKQISPPSNSVTLLYDQASHTQTSSVNAWMDFATRLILDESKLPSASSRVTNRFTPKVKPLA